MIRVGLYAQYHGVWYEAAHTRDGQIKLVYRGDAAPDGFHLTPYGSFLLSVSAKDVDDLEIIRSFATYRGHTLEIANVQGDRALLSTADAQIAAELGMEHVDRHDYRLMVDQSQLEHVFEKSRKLEP